MALRVKRDADNKFYIYVDWNPWIDAQAVLSPNGPALTITITSVSWSIPAALTQEGDTPANVVGGIAYFVGSSGTNGVSYPITCTVTYDAAEIGGSSLTQDQSLTLILEEQ